MSDSTGAYRLGRKHYTYAYLIILIHEIYATVQDKIKWISPKCSQKSEMICTYI